MRKWINKEEKKVNGSLGTTMEEVSYLHGPTSLSIKTFKEKLAFYTRRGRRD